MNLIGNKANCVDAQYDMAELKKNRNNFPNRLKKSYRCTIEYVSIQWSGKIFDIFDDEILRKIIN